MKDCLSTLSWDTLHHDHLPSSTWRQHQWIGFSSPCWPGAWPCSTGAFHPTLSALSQRSSSSLRSAFNGGLWHLVTSLPSLSRCLSISRLFAAHRPTSWSYSQEPSSSSSDRITAASAPASSRQPCGQVCSYWRTWDWSWSWPFHLLLAVGLLQNYEKGERFW